MKNFLVGIRILYLKEFKETLKLPMTYILAALFSLIVGWLFFNYLASQKVLTQKVLEGGVWIPTLGNMNFIFLFFIPLITMRQFSLERRQGTLEFLFSSRLSNWQILIGKFLSSLTFSIFILSLTLIFPVVLFLSGHKEIGHMLVGYLGVFFTLTCYLSVGLFTSYLCDNQISAALMAFSILLVIMLFMFVGNFSSNYLLNQFFLYLSIPFHVQNLFQGVIRTYNIVYFCSFVLFFFYLTERYMDSRNW